MMLTFELARSSDQLEIHADREGLQALVAALQQVVARGGHEHLMTPEWGGRELTSEKQGEANTVLHEVSVYLWPRT